MTDLQFLLGYLQSNGWMTVAALFSAGYLLVLGLMILKIRRDGALPEADRPGPRPLFYLGQAYLAFIWPIPLFMVLEALDYLTTAS